MLFAIATLRAALVARGLTDAEVQAIIDESGKPGTPRAPLTADKVKAKPAAAKLGAIATNLIVRGDPTAKADDIALVLGKAGGKAVATYGAVEDIGTLIGTVEHALESGALDRIVTSKKGNKRASTALRNLMLAKGALALCDD